MAQLLVACAAVSLHAARLPICSDRRPLPPIAAELMGDEEETAFWRRLPATLAWLQHTLESSRRRSSGGRASSTDDATRGAPSGLARTSADPSSTAGSRPPLGGGSSHGGSVHGGGPSPKFAAGAAAAASAGGSSSSGGRRLWEEGLELAEARERSGWHEQMSRRVFENSEDLQVLSGALFRLLGAARQHCFDGQAQRHCLFYLNGLQVLT